MIYYLTGPYHNYCFLPGHSTVTILPGQTLLFVTGVYPTVTILPRQILLLLYFTMPYLTAFYRDRPYSYCILPGQTSLFLTGAYILYCYCLTVADPAVTILLRQTHLLHAGPDPTVTIVPGQTLPFLARPDPTVILDPIVSCWARPYSCYCVLPVQIILLLHLTGT